MNQLLKKSVLILAVLVGCGLLVVGVLADNHCRSDIEYGNSDSRMYKRYCPKL